MQHSSLRKTRSNNEMAERERERARTHNHTQVSYLSDQCSTGSLSCIFSAPLL